MRFSNVLPFVLIIAVAFVGCSKPDAEPTSDSATDSGKATGSSQTQAAAEDKSPKQSFKPIKLGGGSSSGSKKSDSSGTAAVDTKPPNIDDVINGLRPLQIVLGKWNGVVDRASSSEVHEWIWDFRSDKQFPSLVLTAPEGNFFNRASITFDPRVNKYKMTTVDEEEVTRHYEGKFTADPEDVPEGDGKTVHRTFKLQLTEIPNPDRNTRWQYVFNQQKNNRYLIEVYRAKGKSDYRRIDTIGTQRDGTSLARSDEDYGDRTCVISQGLGTSQVSFKGKSYWVCCSGCAAAFNDDPETWIARFEEKQKEMEKKK
jgi:hypothetical protein